MKKNKKWTVLALICLLMLMLMVAPSAMLFFGGQSQSDILVIDNSGVIVPHLKSDENVRYTATSGISVDSAFHQRPFFDIARREYYRPDQLHYRGYPSASV